MRRKFLFLVFTDEPCKQKHAFLYAVDLHKKGYDVKLVVEGLATAIFRELACSSPISRLFEEAKACGIIAGACMTASNGCGSDRASVVDLVTEQNVALLQDMEGHAGIESFIRDGYEVLVF